MAAVGEGTAAIVATGPVIATAMGTVIIVLVVEDNTIKEGMDEEVMDTNRTSVIPIARTATPTTATPTAIATPPTAIVMHTIIPTHTTHTVSATLTTIATRTDRTITMSATAIAKIITISVIRIAETTTAVALVHLQDPIYETPATEVGVGRHCRVFLLQRASAIRDSDTAKQYITSKYRCQAMKL